MNVNLDQIQPFTMEQLRAGKRKDEARARLFGEKTLARQLAADDSERDNIETFIELQIGKHERFAHCFTLFDRLNIDTHVSFVLPLGNDEAGREQHTRASLHLADHFSDFDPLNRFYAAVRNFGSMGNVMAITTRVINLAELLSLQNVKLPIDTLRGGFFAGESYFDESRLIKWLEACGYPPERVEADMKLLRGGIKIKINSPAGEMVVQRAEHLFEDIRLKGGCL